MSAKRTVVLDTSAINALEDGGTLSEPLMHALELGYEVRLTAMCADEIVAHSKNLDRRDALLRRFFRLRSNAACILPPHEVIRKHVTAFHESPSAYDWHKVFVRSVEYERILSFRTLPSGISDEQRSVHFALDKQFRVVWKSLRRKLDEIIKRNPDQKLNTFDQAAEACVKPGGVLWGFGAGLYGHAFTNERPDLTDEQVRPFIEACPPFRALCYAFVKAWFDFSLSPLTHVKTRRAGRNDLLMAAYLPYGDVFITGDYPQRLALMDIARVAQVPCEVMSLEQFSDGFNVGSPVSSK